MATPMTTEPTLVERAMARSRATTRTEQLFLHSDLFEPLLANLLAFVKLFQKVFKVENGFQSMSDEKLRQLRKMREESMAHLSRSYLAVIIDFSNHRNILADQKFFLWLHEILCQFIENSVDRTDTNLMEATNLELHRIFQGDRFNVEAKKPAQVAKVYGKKKISKWKLGRYCEPLSKAMINTSPVVGGLLPTRADKIKSFLDTVNQNSPREKARRRELARPSTAASGDPSLRASSSLSRGPGQPRAASAATMRSGVFVTDVPLQRRARPSSSLLPSPQSPDKPRRKELAGQGGWEGRVHALCIMEKRNNWKVSTPTKWVNWQSRTGVG